MSNRRASAFGVDAKAALGKVNPEEGKIESLIGCKPIPAEALKDLIDLLNKFEYVSISKDFYIQYIFNHLIYNK